MDPCWYLSVPNWVFCFRVTSVGSASDQCKCSWGKCRPFILVLSICCICGLACFTKTYQSCWAKPQLPVLIVLINSYNYGWFLVQVPYKYHPGLPEGHTKFGYIIMLHGYHSGLQLDLLLAYFNWSSNFSTQVKIICGISLVIILFCVTLTLFSVNERNP